MKTHQLATNHPVATYSADHTNPGGTRHDNSRNRRFNNKAYALFTQKTPLCILDLGCAGGGFVKDCIDDGHFAIGLEGSDYSLLRQRAEWATIPDSLFTCDITEPFTLTPPYFDLVTAWEVMEHISKERLPGLCANIRNHLAPKGLWVMSVSEQQDGGGGHHVCLHNRNWWLEMFDREGFVFRHDLWSRFTLDDWVRGPRQGAPESFHLILEMKDVSHAQ